MKKSFLIRLFSVIVFFLTFFSFISCSDEKVNEEENVVTIDQLPQKAKDFLDEYFYGYSVIKIEQEIDDTIVLYEVDLQDGYEVVFNEEGEWTQVVAPYGKTIPEGFIPDPVLQTLNDRFQGYGLNQINTTGEGYKVELSNNQGGAGLDVFFNMSGEIIGIDELD